MVVVDYLGIIINYFASLGSTIIALLELFVSGLALGLFVLVSIIPLVLKLIPLFIALLPPTLVPFVICAISIYFIKFLLSHGVGKGSSNGDNFKYRSKKGE